MCSSCYIKDINKRKSALKNPEKMQSDATVDEESSEEQEDHKNGKEETKNAPNGA